MKRRSFLAAAGAGWLGWTVGKPFPQHRSLDGERLVVRWSWAMGQSVKLLLFVPDEDAGLEAAQAALAELRRIEAALSLFDPGSDLVALNQRAGKGPVRVGPDLLAVLVAAERFRRVTGGAFDPAVEPLMRAWGFREPRAAAPSEAELTEARAAVHAARVEIRGAAVTLPASHTRLDLGGIGVGYGLDRAGAVLRRAGVRRALLDLSGDLLALGTPPGHAGWPVDIAHPSGDGVVRTVLLRDAALATSANTMTMVRYGAITCGHVLDPATGRGACALTQVTAIADTAVTADALSTGMLVSGRRPAGLWGVVTVV